MFVIDKKKTRNERVFFLCLIWFQFWCLFVFEMLSQVAHKSRKSVALSQSADLAVLFKKIVVNYRIGGGRFVNPALVEIFGKLAVGDNEF